MLLVGYPSRALAKLYMAYYTHACHDFHTTAIYTSLFTKHMVAITTKETKPNTTKDYRNTKSNYINIANSNYLVFIREKFITAFFNQLAW